MRSPSSIEGDDGFASVGRPFGDRNTPRTDDVKLRGVVALAEDQVVALKRDRPRVARDLFTTSGSSARNNSARASRTRGIHVSGH